VASIKQGSVQNAIDYPSEKWRCHSIQGESQMDDRKLAKAIRNAIMNQIEQDRCINGENVELAVRKELGVSDENPEDGVVHAEIAMKARDLIQLLRPMNKPASVDLAVSKLESALKRIGV
jgi:hypothetical protein